MRDIMISEILGILIFPVISASDRLICLKDSCEFVQVGNQSARKSHCLFFFLFWSWAHSLARLEDHGTCCNSCNSASLTWSFHG